MTSEGFSLRQLCRQATGRASGLVGLREATKKGSGPLRLSYSPAALSVMAHNMALLPAFYKGTDRSGTIGQIVGQILAARPTIVGLSEVWVGDERDEIREALAPWYPHWIDGPEAHLPKVSNGGSLLLSSEPVTATNTPALYAQLNELNAFVEGHRDPGLTTLIMGDLNIPGENAGHYAQLIQRLGGPVDCWTATGNAPDSGYTLIVDSNFYDDPDDRPKENQRLDYVLLKAGSASIAMIDATEVLNFTHDGRYISDHLGISARFNALCEIT